MKKILNLTQHAATAEQIAAGVVDLDAANKARLIKALTFDEQPDVQIMVKHAQEIVSLVNQKQFENINVAMIGGAPFFMSTFSKVLKNEAIFPVYAFSKRASVEKQNADGTVTKTSEFKHEGFIYA